MVEEVDRAALKLLQRGVELDQERRYTEALLCYQEGMQLLIDFMKNMLDPEKKKCLTDKVKEYMSRAEALKSYVKRKKEEGKYREEIKIENDSVGHSYESVFGRFFDDEVENIVVEDAYIRNYNQCQNFLRFCELAVRKSRNLKTIKLITSRPQEVKDQKSQQDLLEKIRRNLNDFQGISLVIVYDPNLHDRQITLSNGWVIKIGRGLDYFKRVDQFAVGYFDYEQRPCLETKVDIFPKNSM